MDELDNSPREKYISIANLTPDSRQPLCAYVEPSECNVLALQNSVTKLANALYRREWAILILASPFLLFPSPSTVPALIIVPGLGIIAWLAGKDAFPRTPLNTSLLLLSAMLLVSTVATYDLTLSLPKIAGMFLGIGAFFAFANYGKDARGFTLCLLILLATGSAIAIVGLFGTEWNVKFDLLSGFTYRFAPRITGLPGAENGFSPNELAGALLWLIPLLLALSLATLTRWRNQFATFRRRLLPSSVLLAEATLLVLFVFLLCQSRSAYIGLAVSGLVLIPLILQPRWRFLFLSALVVIFVLIGAYAWQYGASSLLHEVFGSGASNDPISPIYGFEGRVRVWSLAISGIQRYPITGMGMNTFRQMVNMLNPLDPPFPGRDIAHAHNEFLQAALDLGLPGLIAFGALYVGSFWMLRSVWDRTARQVVEGSGERLDSGIFLPVSTRALVWGLGGGLLAHLLYGLSDAVTLGAKPGILFWMLLGLVVSLYQQKQSEISIPSTEPVERSNVAMLERSRGEK